MVAVVEDQSTCKAKRVYRGRGRSGWQNTVIFYEGEAVLLYLSLLYHQHPGSCDVCRLAKCVAVAGQRSTLNPDSLGRTLNIPRYASQVTKPHVHSGTHEMIEQHFHKPLYPS
jgi:hypothetical protein